MIVLSITMLGEFLSANVSTPFLLFMVKGFGELSDDAEVALWTGIIVSTFFLTQFVTSLLWATVAEKHGRRAVLVSFTPWNSSDLLDLRNRDFFEASCLHQAVTGGLRCNEGRAYAILGFCWGFGGVAGAIIGGSFERPADKWPDVFKDIAIFNTYPYLLPCAIASTVMLSGSILSCFLGPDGGPREGAIQLGPEKDDPHPTIPEEESVVLESPFEEEESTGLTKLTRKISRRFSNIFAKRVSDAHTPGQNIASTSVSVPLNSPPTNSDRARSFSRTSRANGSAYGYSGAYRHRLASNPTLGAFRRGSLASTLRRRRGSNFDAVRDSTETPDLNFAQRLLMANENAVTNIADLWVASAINADNEDVFESDEEDGLEGGNDLLEGEGLAVLEAQRLLSGEGDEHLGTIAESGQTSQVDAESLREPPPSLASQIPTLIIVQYGVMALHTTTHDQIFMSYLVSKYESGGLNLNAGHFAQLIALMCFVQIAYQFYLYPNMGYAVSFVTLDPVAESMFRIGTILFIPSYLTVVLYRPLASPEDGGNLLLMIVTPPSAVGYANGIAQSIVSLARCVGPVIGGYVS
ncbi:hypothetical protein EST38_g9972 [Candolleomyces aberdarensis]|uniref:Uncharacterized protein n=1 Tax=Candolleomyces aberdarensis TaxID=2316362 RepID=A0A4Q2DB04_9AGAR|nr:hypothetical protein EST38_g9972 [Candolleomyces aberdarensis]